MEYIWVCDILYRKRTSRAQSTINFKPYQYLHDLYLLYYSHNIFHIHSFEYESLAYTERRFIIHGTVEAYNKET
jgi:hypothetical protein